MKSINEELLNRFVSDELSLEQENDVLVQCEMEPDGYRQVVLAMVEHRRMVKAMSTLVDLPEEDCCLDPAESATTNNRWLPWITGVAAMLLGIVFGATAFSGKDGLISPTVAERNRDASPVPTLASSEPPSSRPVSSNDEPRGRETAPAVESSDVGFQLARGLRVPPAFSNESRRRLIQSGWQVEDEPLLLLFDSDNGQQFAIPANNTRIRYVSNK